MPRYSATRRSVARKRSRDLISDLLSALLRTLTNPLTLTLLTIVIIHVIADVFNNGVGPLKIVLASLHKEYEATSDTSNIEKILLKATGRFVRLLADNEARFITAAAIGITILLKPSAYNRALGLFIVASSFVLRTANIYIYLTISLCFWGYTQLQRVRDKIIIVAISMILVIANIELKVLNENVASYNSSVVANQSVF